MRHRAGPGRAAQADPTRQLAGSLAIARYTKLAVDAAEAITVLLSD